MCEFLNSLSKAPIAGKNSGTFESLCKASIGQEFRDGNIDVGGWNFPNPANEQQKTDTPNRIDGQPMHPRVEGCLPTKLTERESSTLPQRNLKETP